ncbi:MAG TPA: response regulator [Gemmatimonadaceae bacterium]|nr:response regulator [Gemmatimonadaceae bacterium]
MTVIEATSGAAGPEGSELSLVSSEFRASLRILLVDDERTLRETCRTILTELGYRVEVATKGDEGIQQIQRRPWDIVLTDLYLPDVTGVELCRAALERHPETLVIVMTGNPSVRSNLEVLQAGAWDYLPKPFSATHLEILIGRAAHTVLVSRESRELGRADAEGVPRASRASRRAARSRPRQRFAAASSWPRRWPRRTPRCSSPARRASARK